VQGWLEEVVVMEVEVEVEVRRCGGLLVLVNEQERERMEHGRQG
jgi:hypothetical protein